MSPTPQEEFWAGPDGDAYTARNGDELLAAKVVLFDRILGPLAFEGRINSVLEFGANRGLNLQALRKLLPDAILAGVEINYEASQAMRLVGGIDAFYGDALTWRSPRDYDLTLSKGFLIHIAPDELPKAYENLYSASRRYILIAEYFSPTPVEIEYRGQMARLWKRDFAGEMLDRFPDLKVVDYGFVWRRDPIAPMDDITWVLLEKAS